MNRIFGTSLSTAFAAVLIGCVAAVLTGCSASQFLPGDDIQPVTGAAISGVVHGGQNPITSATVQLWVVGASGYGSAASKLGPSVQTDSNGNFTFTPGSYTCPAAPSHGNGNTYVYITSSGGNPGLDTGTNANIMLAAGLGSCGSLSSSTFIDINEVTTAATAYALGQYFTTTFGAGSTDSFGAPNTTQAQVGIANAFSTINSLVNTSTGNAVSTATLTGPGGSVTMTPESAKLNTVADILAACVNSAGGTAGDSSPCGMLFDGVVTAAGTPPTDTLQAAVYMSLNPNSTNSNTDWPTDTTCTNNVCVLYGLASGYPQFVGSSTQPNDWTLGIQYAGTSSTMVLSGPLDLAADASGNIWVLNNPGSSNNSLTELTPTGTPQFSSTLTSGSATLASEQPRNLAIDTNGNIWVPTSSGSAYLIEWMPGSSTENSLALGKASYGIAIDGSNDVFVSQESASTTYSFYEFTGGTLATTNEVEFPSDVSVIQPEYMAIDTSGNVWATGGSVNSSATTMVELSGINLSSCTSYPCSASNGLASTYTTVTVGSLLGPYALAAAPSAIWVANAGSGANTVTELTGSAGSISGTAYGSASSLNSPHYVAVDGSGNIWVANKNTGANGGTISELSSTGAVLSGTSGEVGFQHVGLSSGEGIAVDPSGNVWVADDTTSGAAAYSVFEMVGAASPTVTPIALALKDNAVAAKP